MYTINDNIDGGVYITDAEADRDTREKQKDLGSSGTGFYVYDIERLLNGKVEKYKIASAIGGVCYHIDKSTFAHRFSFIKNYSSLTVIPFPHINSLKCAGMSQM